MWCLEKKVFQKFSVPYVHETNGRIERANKTIRSGLKKSDKFNSKDKLEEVVCVYNGQYNTSPSMVLLSENHDMVYSHSKKYASEFKDSFNQQFSIGEKVYIRNDHKNNIMDKEFDTFGTVIDIL
ncbi:hypothetical protein M153_322800077 [Pseudoloma neurophilia]|uniref:Integrase catalytic domain-containing protein n=1 Tax=Pseudoloma neurophilia TaxID=146866 RepID=A0A0R0LXW7_9MICR|nr:hypothetical protein M153_322800077 [Pseudoloma neurophilia]